MSPMEIINLIVLIAGILTIVKFLFDLQNRITKLEVNTTNALTNIKVEVANLSMRIERLEMKFGILEERNTATNQRVDKLEVELKE